MPVQFTYPGIYIEEIESGVHSITGVSTATCAFMGRTLMGPTDEPRILFGFGDYQRMYGGLSRNCPMSYAVRDFFLNGGSEAVIVRLLNTSGTPAVAAAAATPAQPAVAAVAAVPAVAAAGGKPATPAVPAKPAVPAVPAKPAVLAAAAVAGAAKASVTDGLSGLIFTAGSEGVWANTTVTVSANPASGANPAKAAIPAAPVGLSVLLEKVNTVLAAQLGMTATQTDNLCNMTVSYQPAGGGPATVERFINVKLNADDLSANRADLLLAAQSNLVTAVFTGTAGTGLPDAPAWLTFAGGLDGPSLQPADYTGDSDARTGMYQLEHVDLFNILCIPPDTLDGDTDNSVYAAAAQYCQQRRAMLLVDPPTAWKGHAQQGKFDQISPTGLTIAGTLTRNAAVYFPRVRMEDPLLKNQVGTFVPCGIIAGVWASTDLTRGVWKAPAGLDAGLNGVAQLDFKLSDQQNGLLNPLGINCLRDFVNVGPVVWGARTMRGADILEDDYKYIPVRRLTLFLEESLYRGTQWAVFEPNDENLWSSLRLSIDTFMADLNRQGAFYHYKIACGATTTSQSDIDQGIVRVVVAFAPVKPAEFVVLEITQQAGQLPA